MINQCDGCNRGLPIKDNIHYYTDNKLIPYMVCTKDRCEDLPKYPKDRG